MAEAPEVTAQRYGDPGARARSAACHRLSTAAYETAVESLIDLLWDGTPDCMGGTPDLFAPQCRGVHLDCRDPWGCWESRIKEHVAAVRAAAKTDRGASS